MPFHTPTVPFWTTISEAKMKPQSSDSYQPRESGVHSNRCTRGGLGSRSRGSSLSGGGDERSVRMVCKGRVGSQESIQWAVGSKSKVGDEMVVAWLFRLVVLFCRENEGWPAGILPRAFSDMPRNCVGSGSSLDEDMEAVRELWVEGDDCEGVRSISSSSSSDSSSSPMANAPPSSGTSLNVGVLALSGLRMLSTELFRDVRVGLAGGCEASAASLLRCFIRSISSWPLSRVKERNVSNRFFDLKTPCTKILLSLVELALAL